MNGAAIRVAALAVGLVAGSVGCVDGTTANCSDAGIQCGPDYDAYPPDSGDDSSPVDSSPTDSPADSPPTDSPPGDAPADAPREAGAG